MTRNEVEKIFESAPDTVVDPISGNFIIVKSRKLLADSIYRYKIYKEWEFDPSIGKISALIKYVAPVIAVYGDDGLYRGKQKLFWLGYHDLSNALAEHNATRQFYAFNESIWKSGFGFETTNQRTMGPWKRSAISTIDIRDIADQLDQSGFDGVNGNETLLPEYIIDQFKRGKITAWSATAAPFSKILSKEEFMDLITSKPDTSEVTDANTGQTALTIMVTDFNPQSIVRYQIMESWTLDPTTGNAEIEIKGVAPIQTVVDKHGIVVGSKVLFWVNYADIQPFLSRWDQYHPRNTFALHIWDSFFTPEKTLVWLK